jgi:exopolysaccharide biosynthesis protein
MLVSRGSATERLNSFETGQKLDISIDWADSKMTDTTDVIQGGPMLIKDGILCLNNEGLPENFTHKPHPRTIVASDGYYLWFFVFDGRNPWHSRGVTLKEAGQILIDMGMLQALNLDGGGSTEMIWHNRIINMPSGGIERPFPYAVIIKGQGGS